MITTATTTPATVTARGFTVTATAHAACADCEAEADSASIMAQARGSNGAKSETCRIGEDHWATVTREPAPVDPDDAWYGDPDDVPVADSAEDVTTRTIPIDGGSAHVETFPDGHTELVVRIGHRVAAALILSEREAQQIGRAMSPLTVGDYWDLCDRLGTDGTR